MRRVFDNLILHIHPRTVPEESLRFTLTWGLGGMAIVLVLLQLVTGVLLMFAYEPFPGLSLSPQGVSALILRKLRESAQAHLQQPVDGAVVTVPASFDSRQREATLNAAHLAGFDRRQITLIDEPTAAILDYVSKQIRRRVSYISFEEPQAILSEIDAGVAAVSGAHERTTILADRRQAIRAALEEAGPGDVVLLAGKGHETTQTIGDRVEPFDEFGRRIVTVRGRHGPVEIVQGITELTPHWAKVEGITHVWETRIASSSIPSDVLLKLLGRQGDAESLEHQKTVARYVARRIR